MTAPDTGNRGATGTLTFGTSAFAVDVYTVGGLGMTLPVLNGSHLATVRIEEKFQGDLWDLDPVECEYWFDPEFDQAGKQPPVSAIEAAARAPETITIEYPVQTGDSTGLQIAGTGFMNTFNHPSLVNNELQSASFAFVFDGQTGPTWTDPAV